MYIGLRKECNSFMHTNFVPRMKEWTLLAKTIIHECNMYRKFREDELLKEKDFKDNKAVFK